MIYKIVNREERANLEFERVGDTIEVIVFTKETNIKYVIEKEEASDFTWALYQMSRKINAGGENE